MNPRRFSGLVGNDGYTLKEVLYVLLFIVVGGISLLQYFGSQHDYTDAEVRSAAGAFVKSKVKGAKIIKYGAVKFESEDNDYEVDVFYNDGKGRLTTKEVDCERKFNIFTREKSLSCRWDSAG